MADFDFNWATVQKAELKNIDEAGNPKKPVVPGIYDATLSEVKAQNSKGGAFGVYFTYTIIGGAEDGRQVKDNIFLKSKKGDVIPFGGQKLKQRLLACGLTVAQVENFKFPTNDKMIGDFKLILDANVKVETTLETIKEGEAAGVMVARVSKVYRKSAEAEQAAG